MKYIIKILHPLHIGTGKNINPVEYVIDNLFYRIDMDALFRDASFDNEKFISNTKGKQLYLGDLGSEICKNHARYTINFLDQHTEQNLISSLGSPNAEVFECIKNRDLPYIPGSSIKGAIRTAILWYALKNNEYLMQKAEGILYKQGGVKEIEADDAIIKLVFGKNPNYDLLRTLQVSDSDSVEIDNLLLSEVKTLSTKYDGHGWKPFTVFIECLKSGTILEGRLKTDNFLLKTKAAEKLGFGDKQELVGKISEICNYFANEFIDAEIKFYKKYKLDPLANAYEELADSIPPSGKGFLLHLGWGSGWHGMTIGKLLQDSQSFDFEGLRSKFRLGKRGVDEFPKTRKIIFEQDQPKYPIGWVKILLKES
jgi:CRISPR-associated protein Csm5